MWQCTLYLSLAILLVIEQLVLRHLIVGHWLAKLVHLVKEVLAYFRNGFDLQFVNHISNIKGSSTVAEVLNVCVGEEMWEGCW